MKLSHTRDTRHERDSKQATSNKKQQEPIDEGTKNSTSLNHSLTHTSLFLIIIIMILLDACMPFQSISKREREDVIEIAFIDSSKERYDACKRCV